METAPVPFGPPCLPPLGDAVARALALVGVTADRVTAWLGRPCGCKERRERLNQLTTWANRTLSRGASAGKVWLGSCGRHLSVLISE